MGVQRVKKSVVREHLKQMLFIAGKLSAYEAHKHYNELFAHTSQRNVYYQLDRGVQLEEFDREERIEQGDFSWGTQSRKVYYFLRSSNNVSADNRIRNYFLQLRGRHENSKKN